MYKPQIFLLWYLKVDIKFLSNLQKMYGLGTQLLSLKYYGLQYFWKINSNIHLQPVLTDCINMFCDMHMHLLISYFECQFWKKSVYGIICNQLLERNLFWNNMHPEKKMGNGLIDYLCLSFPRLVLDHYKCPNGI